MKFPLANTKTIPLCTNQATCPSKLTCFSQYYSVRIDKYNNVKIYKTALNTLIFRLINSNSRNTQLHYRERHHSIFIAALKEQTFSFHFSLCAVQCQLFFLRFSLLLTHNYTNLALLFHKLSSLAQLNYYCFVNLGMEKGQPF